MSDPQPPARGPYPAVAPDPLGLVQRRTMRVLVVMQIIGTVGVGVAPSIGVLLAGEVTNSEAWAGLARTASTLGAALLGLPLGNLAARRGRRIALATGWWTAAAGAALLVAAAQWSLVVPLFIGLLLIGAGSAVSLQARFAATDLAEPHHKGRSLALVVWVGTIGSVLGPNLGVPGEIIHRATGLSVFAGAFLVAAACLALAGVVVFLRLKPDPLLTLQASVPSPAAPAGKKRAPVRRILAELRINRPARFAMIAILSAQVVMVSIMTMTPVHLAHQGGSITVIGITISLHIAGMYALAPLVGFIVDRHGHRPSIVAGILVFTASATIGALRPADTGWIMVSLFLLGVGWSFINVAGSALFSRVVSTETRASSQGGVDALANLCGAVAAFAAGPLLAASSFPVLSVLATAVLLPLAVLTVRRRHKTG
ncbi:MFS transporter [Arthrobacter zhangbolii]|uniref:MFS transporter n=1 Tax=Arthrobacter zhangbolii TaxID=2886936 RepID=A0A9X1M8G3_9MICC|nr:MFS transporter [Arthrobacter zhangbolii]MCC3273533.1 MFS transporter [Arthrobacter zhangbolii]UON92346.1 MFS transporter [Arthrobacter zhangbolii]